FELAGGGTGSGVISVSPKRLTFGRVRVRCSRTKSVVIRNKSKEQVLNVTISELKDPFSLVKTDTAFTLRPGQKKVVRVRYAPDKRGKDSDELVIDSSDCINPEITVPISGTAIRRRK